MRIYWDSKLFSSKELGKRKALGCRLHVTLGPRWEAQSPTGPLMLL